MYKIVLSRSAAKSLDRIPEKAVIQCGKIIDSLKEEPRPVGCKKLTEQEGYRVRSGEYRILYTIDDSQKIVSIFRIGHRRDVYRKL